MFKAIVIRMLTELRKRIHKPNENFNKVLENVKKNQSKLKNTICEIKNTLEGITSPLDDTEEHINHLEDRIMEITQPELQKEKQILNMKTVYGTSGTASNILIFTV